MNLNPEVQMAKTIEQRKIDWKDLLRLSNQIKINAWEEEKK